jgi:hypothetical protein
MKQSLVALVILLLHFNQIYSQDNFQPGYIVTSNNDTISGLININGWEITPLLLEFKTTQTASPSIFKPIDLKGFKVNNEIYKSEILKSEISPRQTNTLEYNPSYEISLDTVFLQQLIDGKINLYRSINKMGNENFYVNEGNSYDLLLFKKYLKLEDGKYILRENKKYIGQLKIYFKDCSMLASKIDKTVYNTTNLVSLFEKYHNCISFPIANKKEIEKIKIELGPIVGLSLHNLKFTSDSESFNYLTKVDFNNSTDITLGGFVNLVLPLKQRKWSFYNEILYSTFDLNAAYLDFQNENIYKKNNVQIAYNNLNISNLLRYKFKIKSFYIFLNGGISNTFSLGLINKNNVESKFFSTEKNEEIQAIKSIKKNETGVVLGSGLIYKKFSFECRYRKGNGISDLPVLNSDLKTFYFLLGYTI